MKDTFFLLEGSLGVKRTLRKAKSLEKKGHFLGATTAYKKTRTKKKIRRGDIKVPKHYDNLNAAEDIRKASKEHENHPFKKPTDKEKEGYKSKRRAALQAQKTSRQGEKPLLRKVKLYKS